MKKREGMFCSSAFSLTCVSSTFKTLSTLTALKVVRGSHDDPWWGEGGGGVCFFEVNLRFCEIWWLIVSNNQMFMKLFKWGYSGNTLISKKAYSIWKQVQLIIYSWCKNHNVNLSDIFTYDITRHAHVQCR